MISLKLNQILHYNQLWRRDIDRNFANILQTIQPGFNWNNTQSRTLGSALSETVYNYCDNAYTVLAALCSLLNNKKQTKIYTKYRIINSEAGENLNTNLMEFLDIPDMPSTTFNICLYHIPKGKSYLRKVLDEQETPFRLKQVETLCIDNPQHFIRIYKNFNNTGYNSITVFSDQYDDHLINTLFIMLPHLIDITKIKETEEQPLSEEDKQYNTRVTLLFAFFEKLYDIMKAGNIDQTLYNEPELQNKTTELLTLLRDYMNTFDFTTSELNAFMENLAKIRNESAQSHISQQLKNTNIRIRDLEDNLARLYIDKAKYDRALIAYKTLAEDDIKPLLETIKMSKAIELLSATANELVLRITIPFQYFQETDFEVYEKNNSSTYNRLFDHSYRDSTFLKKIFHKVFVTREYKLLAQSIIHMQLNSNNYNNEPLYLFAEQRHNTQYPFTQFPNPHLYHHNCWGEARAEIQKNTCEGNFELIIMQMIAATQSINIAENASFVNGLLSDIHDNQTLRDLCTFVIDTPEGTKNLNLKELIEYEKALDKAEKLKEIEKKLNEISPTEYKQIEIEDSDENWETPIYQENREGANEHEEN